MDKKVIKFGDTEIKKHKFHQHDSLTSINNIDINEIVVSKISFNKMILNTLFVTKMIKKLDLYLYCLQK